MAFGPKPWKDKPDGTTPISAAGLIDLEARLSNYTDLVGPAANVRLSGAQSIPNGTTTTVSWGTEVYDTAGMWDAGNPTVLTVTRAGLYLVTGNLSFAAGTGARVGRLYRNTTGIASQAWSESVGVATEIAATAHVACAVGDLLSMVAYQNSGAALNINDSATGPCFLAAVWLGRMP